MNKKLFTLLLTATLLSGAYHQTRLYHKLYMTNLYSVEVETRNTMNLYMILNAPVDKISYSLHEIQDYTQTYKQDEIENGAYAMLGLKPKNYTLLNGNLGPVEETCQYASKQILVLYRTRYGVWTDVGDIYTPEALKITDCKEN